MILLNECWGKRACWVTRLATQHAGEGRSPLSSFRFLVVSNGIDGRVYGDVAITGLSIVVFLSRFADEFQGLIEQGAVDDETPDFGGVVTFNTAQQQDRSNGFRRRSHLRDLAIFSASSMQRDSSE